MANKSKHLLHSLGQSMSFARLSLKAKLLWPMLIAAVDDQGRFDADPQVVKWAVCPNIDEIAKDEIPQLLEEMVEQGMILIYRDGGHEYAQLVNWWTYQVPSYARPSDYPAPPGWIDRVRIRRGDAWITENWDREGGLQNDRTDSAVPSPRDTVILGDKAKQHKTQKLSSC